MPPRKKIKKRIKAAPGYSKMREQARKIREQQVMEAIESVRRPFEDLIELIPVLSKKGRKTKDALKRKGILVKEIEDKAGSFENGIEIIRAKNELEDMDRLIKEAPNDAIKERAKRARQLAIRELQRKLGAKELRKSRRDEIKRNPRNNLKNLKSPDEMTRAISILRLIESNDKKILERVFETSMGLLKSQNPAIRISALNALGEIIIKKSVPEENKRELLEALSYLINNESNPHIKTDAIRIRSDFRSRFNTE